MELKNIVKTEREDEEDLGEIRKRYAEMMRAEEEKVRRVEDAKRQM